MAAMWENLPTMWETWVQPLGWEDPPEKGKAMQSKILACRIPWTLWSIGSQRVGHDRVTFTHRMLLVTSDRISTTGWFLCGRDCTTLCT